MIIASALFSFSFDVNFSDIKGYEPVRSGRNLQDRIVKKATDQETFVDTLADFWHGDIKGKTIKDKIIKTII